MLRRVLLPVSLLLFVSFVFVGSLRAMSLMSKEEALADAFGANAKISVEAKEVSGVKLARIKERLGGISSYHRRGANDTDESLDKVEFYVATKGGSKAGVALLDTEPGKWGPIQYLIAIDMKGTVSKVLVLSYEEKRGRPIARASYLSQFTGKTTKSKLTVGDDIVGVSGATISSESSTFAVKKSLVLFEELYKAE